MSRVVLILYFFILYLIINNSGLSEKLKIKKYIILASIGLIIDSGFRHLCIGPDTYQYYEMFEEAKAYSISDLVGSTFKIGAYYYIKDAGYWLFVRVFQLVFPSFRIFLVFIAILFFSALGRFIYTNLNDLKSVLLSYLFYIGMFWYFFSTTGCRQTIAVALLIMAFPLLVNGKYIRYSLVVILCAFFHASAIVALLGLGVMFIRSKKIFSVIVVILIPVFFIARYSLFGYLVEAMEMEDVYGVYLESQETASSVTVTLFYLVIFVFCIIFRDKLATSKNMDYFIKLFFIGMCLLPTMFIAATAMRVTFYFSYTMYILVPSIIKQLDYRKNFVPSILLMLILSFFSIRQTWDYKFFWQEGKVASYGYFKEELPFF